MIGSPLMTMPLASAASRAPVTGAPLLLAPSPEISMTRRSPWFGFSSNSGTAKLIAPGDRGARRPADRRLQDFVGDRVRRFRTVDHPPGNDDLLVVRRRPFEIGHRNLAGRAGFQRLQEFLRVDGLRIALALHGEFVEVHRVGNIHGENQLDIDRRLRLGRRSDFQGREPPCRQRRLRPSPPRPAPLRSRHTSALLPSRVGQDRDTQSAPRKAGTSAALHIQVSRRLP